LKKRKIHKNKTRRANQKRTKHSYSKFESLSSGTLFKKISNRNPFQKFLRISKTNYGAGTYTSFLSFVGRKNIFPR